MKRENRKYILMRYGVIIIMILVVSIAIIVKLFDTTVISADKWNQKAMEDLSSTDTILPTRGSILASDGSVLSTNLTFYTLRIDYRCERFALKAYKAALDSLADSLATYYRFRDREGWKKRLSQEIDKDDSLRRRGFKLLDNISYTEYQRILTWPFFKIKKSSRTGLHIESKLRRVYPYGDMARRSIGSIGEDSITRRVKGISGLEMALDTLLYGEIGVSRKVPLTKEIVNWTDKPPVPGYDIRTTIDVKMQDMLENELNSMLEWTRAEWGVAVLMEVATGDIKAISNLEMSTRRSGPAYIEGMNRAVIGYEPGSVVKPISMMLALEDGIVSNLNQVIPIGASFPYAGGRAITDSHFNSSLTVRGIIEESSNIGMSRIITGRYGSNPGKFYERLKGIGFLEAMHTGIGGERIPRVDSLPNNNGGRISLARQCYGYTTEIPPLYTLSIYNAIANGGRYVRPRLVSQLLRDGVDSTLAVTYIRDRICSETNAAKMREMLTAVVEGKRGTGRRLKNDKVRLAGKTGTAYTIENKILPGGKLGPAYYNTSKKRLAFCGFFPVDNPKYSCIVLICGPKQNAFGAASTSGEVLKNLALRMYSRGMLDNNSNFYDTSTDQSRPTLFATRKNTRYERMGKELHWASGRSVMRSHSEVGKGVPDVKGYGLREAVGILESAGYNVSFNGTGYVSAQNPVPGTELRRGADVHLTLNN